jgi:hypothetical protein
MRHTDTRNPGENLWSRLVKALRRIASTPGISSGAMNEKGPPLSRRAFALKTAAV